ncbi:MAG: hypothetical protein H7842_12925 [Gammaproteobacteria bacterium SHHR-1]
MASSAVKKPKQFFLITAGEQGPPGPPGAGGGGAGEVFILDVTPTASGIVSGKTYVPDTVPANVEISYCLSDTKQVRVHIGCEGGADSYSPQVSINGVPATLAESSTKRWFTGYADLTLESGVNTVTAVSDAGGEDTAEVEVLGAGPAILGISFGPYPGSQTELKAGDTISITVTTEPEATSVSVLLAGAAMATTLAASGGQATGTITTSSASGAQPVSAKARNSFGTYGEVFVSDPLTLNQTYPSFGSPSVVYPAGQSALKGSETAALTLTASNFDTISYNSAQVSVPDPASYAATKTVTNLHTGYTGSGSNVTVSATRAANNATASTTALVKIAAVAPTASVTTSPAGRMVSSPTGITYEVRVTPNQTLLSAPTLSADKGTWTGSWVLSGSYWKRGLIIADSTPKGAGLFSDLTLPGLAGLVGSTITSGAAYSVGGFTLRTLTFPAFSRVAALGTPVADETKTSAVSQGGVTLARQTDTVSRPDGYYIANVAGDYDPNGSYMALSDTGIAGANTTGTLTASIREVA